MPESSLGDEVVELTRRLVATPSPNPPGDERAIAAVVVELLRERGIERTEIVGPSDERPSVIAELDSGRPGPRLMLCGHIDTKPVGRLASWDHDPFGGVIEGGRLHGLGACDMKGGVAAILVALGRMRDGDALPRGSVVAVFTADEEAGSTLGARFLAERNRLHAHAAILTEPAGATSDWQALYLGTRGSVLFRVDLEGAAGHSSLEDHVPGVSATMAMAKVMVDLDRELRALDGVAVNVGATVEGGLHYGVRAPAATLRGDVRFPPSVEEPAVRELVVRTVDAAAHACGPGVRALVRFDELPGGPFRSLGVAPDSAVARACRAAVEEVLGHAPPDGVFPGGTDSFYVQGAAGIPTMPALGPGRLHEAHQPNEYVSLDSLCAAPHVLLAAVRRFLSAQDG